MTGTPILDEAVRAGCTEAKVGCVYPECATGAFKCRPAEIVKSALRAALPWDLPAERLDAMARAYNGTSRWLTFNAGEEEREKAIFLAVYRADPIMRELYPEQFR